MTADDDPPMGSGAPARHAVSRSRRHVDASEQLRSLQAVKIERQGFCDRRRRGSRHRPPGWSDLPKSPDAKISISMSGCRRAKSAKSGIEQVCREGRRQCHPQKPAHALVTPEGRASPTGATTLPSGSRAQGPPRPLPSGGSPKAAFRTCAPRGVPRAARCVRSTVE